MDSQPKLQGVPGGDAGYLPHDAKEVPGRLKLGKD
jgi:hypothetical protein